MFVNLDNVGCFVMNSIAFLSWLCQWHVLKAVCTDS